MAADPRFGRAGGTGITAGAVRIILIGPGNSKVELAGAPPRPPIESEIGLSLWVGRGTHYADLPEGLRASPAHGRTMGLPSATPRNMKNFARLVRFALPYKVRFGLSIACAAMVALLFFSELGAVYPLLHILFNSQNPQKWVAEKIESYRDDITSLEARQVEARYVLEVAPRGKDGYIPLLTGRRQQLEDEIKQVVDRLYRSAARGGRGRADGRLRGREGPGAARPARGAAPRPSGRRGPAQGAAGLQLALAPSTTLSASVVG